jgi:hypothetical protein
MPGGGHVQHGLIGMLSSLARAGAPVSVPS